MLFADKAVSAPGDYATFNSNHTPGGTGRAPIINKLFTDAQCQSPPCPCRGSRNENRRAAYATQDGSIGAVSSRHFGGIGSRRIPDRHRDEHKRERDQRIDRPCQATVDNECEEEQLLGCARRHARIISGQPAFSSTESLAPRHGTFHSGWREHVSQSSGSAGEWNVQGRIGYEVAYLRSRIRLGSFL